MAKDHQDPTETPEEAPLRSLEEAVAGKVQEIAERESEEEHKEELAERREARKRREFTAAALERIRSEYRLDLALPAERIAVEPVEERDDLFTLTVTFESGAVKLAKPHTARAIARPEGKVQWVATFEEQGQPPRQSRPTDFISAITFATTGKE